MQFNIAANRKIIVKFFDIQSDILWLGLIRVVGEVVEVFFDSHKQTRDPRAATEARGEDHAGDGVVGGRVGRRDGPQKVAVP